MPPQPDRPITRVLLLGLLLGLPLAACISIPERHIISSGELSGPSDGDAQCGAVRRSTSSGGASSSALDPTRIDLLVWNIYKGAMEGSLEDLTALSRDKDLVLLQEALLIPGLVGVMADNRLYWRHAAAFSYLQAYSGVLTASGAPPTYHCMLRIREPFIRIPKSMLVTRYPLEHSGQELLVVNVHGVNFELDNGAYLAQLDLLRQTLDGHRGPVILAGDFNTWNTQRIDHLEKLAAGATLKHLDFDNPHRSKLFGHHLDLVFYRGLDALHASAVPVKTSDHNPLSVRFRLADPEQRGQ